MLSHEVTYYSLYIFSHFLSAQNIVSATSACILQLGLYAPTNQDILFSFLPLAHTMERCCELATYMAGGGVAFYSGRD